MNLRNRIAELEQQDDDDPEGRAFRLRRYVDSQNTEGMSPVEIERAEQWRAMVLDGIGACEGDADADLTWRGLEDDDR